MSEKQPRRSGKKNPNSRRAAGLRALAAELPGIAKRALGRRGFADASLVVEWPAVVGHDLARSTEPLRLSFPNIRQRLGGTLTLRVEPSVALALQHLEPQLLQRINGYFGYRAVERIRLRQGTVAAAPKVDEADPARADPALAQPMRQKLAELSDDDLRQALARLARRVQARHGGAATRITDK